MHQTRTSITDPLRIPFVPVGRGRLGMTLCPGKCQAYPRSGPPFARDLRADLDAIVAWGATALVTLIENHEFAELEVEDLGRMAAQAGLEWHHLPIIDDHAPDGRFESGWIYSGPRLHRHLREGRSVVVHCKGGLGRTGTVAARLLVETGMRPADAVSQVRAARPHAIESREQFIHIQQCKALANPDWRERALACLMGGALGDAFGYPVEFDTLAEIRRAYGPQGLRQAVVGPQGFVVSDDTQMTLFTLEGVLDTAAGRDPLPSIRAAYRDWLDTQFARPPSRTLSGRLATDPAMRHRRAPGNTCLSALAAGGNGCVERPLNDSKGCGGVMRTAPIGLMPRLSPDQAFRLAQRAAALTHGHPDGHVPAGAMAMMVRLLLDGMPLAEAAEAAARRCERENGLTAAALHTALAAAHDGDAPVAPADAIAMLGQGWVGEEALAVGVYAALAAGSFTEAVALAANHDGDSDSTASLAGQLWGAAHGLGGMPHDWIMALDVRDPLLRLARRLI